MLQIEGISYYHMIILGIKFGPVPLSHQLPTLSPDWLELSGLQFVRLNLLRSHFLETPRVSPLSCTSYIERLNVSLAFPLFPSSSSTTADRLENWKRLKLNPAVREYPTLYGY